MTCRAVSEDQTYDTIEFNEAGQEFKKIYSRSEYFNLIPKVSANDEQANQQTNNPQGFDGGLSVYYFNHSLFSNIYFTSF